ncbi:hypothetical protein APA_3247 [Pseudanabaena sp. lw0831]|nr:hypothetical protein APA_3247 [Pseudanabaena sp. lw0831]
MPLLPSVSVAHPPTFSLVPLQIADELALQDNHESTDSKPLD